MSAPPATMEDIVAKYIELRDAKKVLKDRYDAKKASIDATLLRFEGAILKWMQANAIDNIKTASGTAYQTPQTSVTVADWPAFLGWVQNTGSWEMLNQAANKTAVSTYKAENQDLPPGVNYREAITVNIRKG
jgi:hypothetical protein